MPTFDATTAECLIFTYKHGLLSKVGHDLKLRVRTFEARVEADRIEATFDPRSLETVSAMKDGRENPRALSERDKRQVLENIARDVLHPDRFPEIRYTAEQVEQQGERWRVRGRLLLHGVERPVPVQAAPEGEHLVARVRLRQPDFRIVPFTAILGTLKIKPEVDIELRVPLAELNRSLE